MNNLISVKSDLNKNINEILSILNDIDLKDNSIIQELTNKNKILNEANIKFLEEIKEKDKILGMNQKTICDYEKQINNLNEIKEEENKFTMVKAKDKEIHEQNKTIDSLKKEIISLKNKLEVVSEKNLKCEITENNDDVSDNTNNDVNEAKTVPVTDSSNLPNELVDVNNNVEELLQAHDQEQEQEQEQAHDQEQDSDGEIEVETVTYRKKDFYMSQEDGLHKIFEILSDGDIGKELGLWIDNKLVKHDKKKKK